MTDDLTTQQKMDALGEALYVLTGTDWELRVHHCLTEPTCPTAYIYPEGQKSSRYRCDRDTIDEAIAGSVDAAYREWIVRESIAPMVPWSESDDPIEQLLAELPPERVA